MIGVGTLQKQENILEKIMVMHGELSQMQKQKAEAESNLSARCAFRVQTPKFFKASIELRVFGCGKIRGVRRSQ